MLDQTRLSYRGTHQISRQRLAFTILAISIVAVLAPSLVGNVHAIGCQDVGNYCYLSAQTNVPAGDATIRVQVDSNVTLLNLPYTFAFRNGTVHTIQVIDVSIKGTSGTRYVFQQWMQCGNQWSSGTSPTMTTPLMLSNYTNTCPFRGPFVAQFNVYPPVGCISNCLLDASTNIPSMDAAVWVRVNTTSTSTLTKLPLTPTLSYSNGTIITIQAMNLTFAGLSGAHYSWKQWKQGTNVYSTPLITVQMIANYTSSGVGAFTAQFDKQYQINITFKDNALQPVNSPNSLTLQSSTGSVVVTSYTNIWLSATVWTVADATWEGITGSVVSQTIDLTSGPSTASVQLKAFPATIHVIDRASVGVANARVTVIFSNSTSKIFTTDSQGNVQLGRVPGGSYTTQITYQGQAMGSWTADASQTPTNTIQLNIGSSPASTQFSAIVILAVFGLAFFLILLAIKMRKPPAPPRFGSIKSSS